MAAGGKNSQAAEHKLAKLYRSIVLSIALTYLSGAIFYADPFNFWELALSELGTTTTLTGTPNLRAALFVSLGMLISGGFLFEAGRFTMSHPTFMHYKVKCWFLYAAGLGALIAIFPNNIVHTIHSLGSAMMIGSVFILEIITLWERKPIMDSLKFNAIIILLSVSVLSYAVAFFSNAYYKQVAQKFCIINLLLVLVEGSHYLDTLSEPFLPQNQVT
ncbi:MAG: hypothetical protein WBB69_05280 [Anaerolineales bacterium]